jgi:hypothetical protein
MKTIKVQIKSVFGNDNVYPICETAILFAKLAGTKTLTSHALHTIKEAGYTVEYI